jgi:chromatin structure-remodeling complex subunit RSC1/2
VYNPNAPRPVEVFHLSDTANAAIPEEIRDQFHCDDQGHVLFFSSAPLDIGLTVQQRLGHSLKYLAAKEERRKLVEAKKRKETSEREERDRAAKRQRADAQTALAARVEVAAEKAVEVMTKGILNGTDEIYKILYQQHAETARQADAKAREQRILADRAIQAKTAQIQANSIKTTFVSLKGKGIYMDEIDPVF